jgi:hypothetical protein
VKQPGEPDTTEPVTEEASPPAKPVTRTQDPVGEFVQETRTLLSEIKLPARAGWHASDPRLDIARGWCIVLRRTVDGWETSLAQVETEHGYSIFLSCWRDPRDFVSEADPWPQDWFWTSAPPPPDGSEAPFKF